MASTITQIMDAIETAIKTIPNLNTTAYVAQQVNPPQAIIGVPTIPSYHEAMGRGAFQLDALVYVLTSAILDRDGQRALAAYANPTGASSVVIAIESDKSLGGVVDDCFVVDFRPLNHEEVGALKYYGGVFTLRIVAKGT